MVCTQQFEWAGFGNKTSLEERDGKLLVAGTFIFPPPACESADWLTEQLVEGGERRCLAGREACCRDIRTQRSVVSYRHRADRGAFLVGAPWGLPLEANSQGKACWAESMARAIRYVNGFGGTGPDLPVAMQNRKEGAIQ